MNTLSFTVHSQEAEFSILNPQGIYQFLQQRQKLDLYEYIGGNKRYLGSYYLNEWAGKDENTFEMEAMDSVGIMSGTSFYGGMYAEITAKALLESILSDAGFVVPVSGRIMLDLDPALENVKLTGWLPISSHREAIQQVAFALGAVADTSRTDEVKVYRVHTAPSETIPRSRKFAGQSVELQGFVTGVEVSEHTYTPGSQTETVFESVLPAGQNKVTFREPVFTFTVAGAAVIESHVNYAVVNVASEQKVTVTGKKYVDNVRLVGVYMQGLPAAQKQNVLKVEEATLVGRPNAAFVAQWVYQWHQNRVRQNFTFLQEGEQVGEKYSVETLYGKTKSGLMVSLDTDLSGGFTAKAVVIGE